MLFALDIGNTNMKVGLFQNGSLMHSWRLKMDKNRTADEYGVQIEMFFRHLGLSTSAIKGIIYSSVIPSLNYTIEHMFKIYYPGVKAMQVEWDMHTGLNIRYEPPQSLGSDRICNAVAARRLYKEECLVTIDFGTASTFNILCGDDFLGGLICPGLKISANALMDNTAMLPKVEFVRPKTLIGANTEHCIQSGLLYGYVGQIGYLIRKIRQELNMPALVISTGGMGELLKSESDCIDISNPTLTLQGLAMLYDMNK